MEVIMEKMGKMRKGWPGDVILKKDCSIQT